MTVSPSFPESMNNKNRPDVERVYYAGNRLYFNEKEAGFSRDVLIKALNAEGGFCTSQRCPVSGQRSDFS